MNRKRNITTRSIVMSGISLLILIVMLAATTFAWFTDSVSNQGNKIKAGALIAGFYASEKVDGPWRDLKQDTNPIFNEVCTQPGDTFTRYIRVTNEACIDLIYDIDLIADVSNLGDVLWFSAEQVSPAPAQNIFQNVLGNNLENRKITGTLNADSGPAIYKLTVKFDEGAGNSYQYPSSFTLDVNLTATQSKYPKAYEQLLKVKTPAELTNAITNGADGQSIVLMNDITMDDINLTYPVNIDLNSYTLICDNFKVIYSSYGTMDISNGIIFANDGLIDLTNAPNIVLNNTAQMLDPDKTEVVAPGQDIKGVIEGLNPGDTVLLSSGEHTVNEPLTIGTDNVTIIGTNDTVFTESVKITGDNVVLDNIRFEIEVEEGGDWIPAPLSTPNKDLILKNCDVERTSNTSQAYGTLVDVGNGVLTAENTTFIAPYDPSTAFDNSPSTINAVGGVNLNNCRIQTDGYGIFDFHVTKGTIKNTIFEGINGRPCLAPVNSLAMNGLVFDGCTFKNSINPLVTGGSYTIKNSTFRDFTGVSRFANIYTSSGPIIFENNTFILNAGQGGIYLTGASWASSDRDLSQITIKGNIFNGSGLYAIRHHNNLWGSPISVGMFPNNTWNGNAVDNV